MSKPTNNNSDVEIPDHLLKQILTNSELRMLKNRYQIIKLLNQKKSIRQIAQELGVGTDTVLRVSKLMDEKKLRITQEKKPATPWIFGKAKE